MRIKTDRVDAVVGIIVIIVFGSLTEYYQGQAALMEKGWRDAVDTIAVKDRAIKALQSENKRLWQRENEVSERIANIKSYGYKPNKLLVNAIYRMHELFPSVPLDTLFAVSKIETSYGSNIRTGMLGEEGWSQFTEENLRELVYFFGGDTSGFKIKDYSDIVTTTEWTYVAFIYARYHIGKDRPVSWSDWNNGKYKKRKAKR